MCWPCSGEKACPSRAVTLAASRRLQALLQREPAGQAGACVHVLQICELISLSFFAVY